MLVGTVSIESSERLSRLLNKRGIKHEVLNAKFHEREAQIVAQAGRLGAVTIATNMAGRGTDILLGGNAEEMARDELMRYDFGIDAEVLDRILHEANWRLLAKDEKELEPVERTVFNQVLEGIRALDIDIDTATFAEIARVYEDLVRKTKAVCSAEHDQVVAAGGLTVIGTERHESRRIDNQLRGRAGRQGDPGETQFYLSLEDDLMRMFGGERMDKISNLMIASDMGDDMPIQHKMISKAVEGAQRKVENINFSMRKNVLEYDDVMNKMCIRDSLCYLQVAGVGRELGRAGERDVAHALVAVVLRHVICLPGDLPGERRVAVDRDVGVHAHLDGGGERERLER